MKLTHHLIARILIPLALLALGAGGAWAALGFTPPAVLNTNAATDAGIDANSQVATDGAGYWVAVWESNDTLGGTIETDGDILVSRSTDNGATWTPTAALNTDAATDSDHDRDLQVTTDGAGNWVAVWGSGEFPSSSVMFSRSTDNGATWTPPGVLGNGDGPCVATDGAGHWVAAWQASGVMVSRSTDSGVTWTPPAVLASQYSGGIQVVTDGAGHWVAVWYSGDTLAGPDTDILVSRSTDNGINWTPPAALNSDAATDSRYDDKPHVATDGLGNWVAVWWGGPDMGVPAVEVSRSTDNGATWTPPAVLGSHSDAIPPPCDSGRRGKLGRRVALSGQPRRDDRGGLGHPGLALDGQWDHLDTAGRAQHQRRHRRRA